MQKIEICSAVKRKTVTTAIVNSDDDDYSKTDQMGTKSTVSFPANKCRTPQHWQLYIQLGYNDYRNKTS
eukprot:8315780-Ditylum_brightwellii.AAC.1